MKKLVIFSLIAVMVAGAAFAQVADGLALGVWGRVGFVPLEAQFWKDGTNDGATHDNGDDDLTAFIGQTWGGGFGRNVRLQFSGSNEFVGFNTWIQTDGGAVGFGDFAGIWAKPFEFLKVDLGLFKEDTLRGKIGDTDFHGYTLDMYAEDQIFTRFGGAPGALVSLTPAEGLFIGVGLPVLPGFNANYGKLAISQSDDENAKAVYERIQIGAGYQIEGIGHFRAQYVGANEFDSTAAIAANAADEDTFGMFKRAEVAFLVSAIEGMTLDIGVKIPFAEKGEIPVIGDGTFSAPITASAGFNMGFGDIGILARIDSFFGGGFKGDDVSTADTTNGAKVNVHLVPTFNLGFATLGIEAGMEINGKSKTGDTENDDDFFNFGIGAWVMKALGENGLIKAGVAYSSKDVGEPDEATANGWFRIPIVAEVWF